MFSPLNAEPPCFDTVHLDGWLAQELIEQAYCIRPASHAGNEAVRQPAFQLHDLFLRFASDHGLEIAHHHGKGMRTEDRAQYVMRVRNVRDPVAHGLVDGVLERFAADVDRPHHGPEELHAEDIERLPGNIFRAHVDLAVQPAHCRRSRRRTAMLARARLGNHAGLAHAFGEKDLCERIVDLVRAGVAEVFALEIYLRAAQMVRESLCEIERRGTAYEFPEIIIELDQERFVLLRREVRGLKLRERGHERLGRELSAVYAEVAFFIRYCHGLAAFRTSDMNFLSFAWSLSPFSFSTPPATSTPYGCTSFTASATFCTVSPPARIILPNVFATTARCQSKVTPVPPGSLSL